MNHPTNQSITAPIERQLRMAWRDFIAAPGAELSFVIANSPRANSPRESSVSGLAGPFSDSAITLLSKSHTREFKSHTREFVLWIGTADSRLNGQQLGGIGVDLELVGRPVSPRLEKRIVRSSKEKSLPLSPLEFWVIKEACYKSNPGNRGTVLPHYQIEDWNEQTKHGEARFNSLKIPFKLVVHDPFVVAFAYTSR